MWANARFGPGELWGVRTDESRARRMLYTRAYRTTTRALVDENRQHQGHVVSTAQGTTHARGAFNIAVDPPVTRNVITGGGVIERKDVRSADLLSRESGTVRSSVGSEHVCQQHLEITAEVGHRPS